MEHQACPNSVAALPPVRGRWPGTCFVCSDAHPHGLHLRFHHTHEGVVCLCTISESYCGFNGMVHGGIISTLLDEAAAYAIFARHGRLGVTREMTTKFLLPVLTNTQLRLEGRVTVIDKAGATVETALHDEKGHCLAQGSSVWSFPRLSRIAGLAKVEEGILQQFLDDCQRIEE